MQSKNSNNSTDYSFYSTDYSEERSFSVPRLKYAEIESQRLSYSPRCTCKDFDEASTIGETIVEQVLTYNNNPTEEHLKVQFSTVTTYSNKYILYKKGISGLGVYLTGTEFYLDSSRDYYYTV